MITAEMYGALGRAIDTHSPTGGITAGRLQVGTSEGIPVPVPYSTPITETWPALKPKLPPTPPPPEEPPACLPGTPGAVRLGKLRQLGFARMGAQQFGGQIEICAKTVLAPKARDIWIRIFKTAFNLFYMLHTGQFKNLVREYMRTAGLSYGQYIPADKASQAVQSLVNAGFSYLETKLGGDPVKRIRSACGADMEALIRSAALAAVLEAELGIDPTAPMSVINDEIRRVVESCKMPSQPSPTLPVGPTVQAEPSGRRLQLPAFAIKTYDYRIGVWRYAVPAGTPGFDGSGLSGIRTVPYNVVATADRPYRRTLGFEGTLGDDNWFKKVKSWVTGQTPVEPDGGLTVSPEEFDKIKGTPWYKNWKVWAAVGGVTAAGVGAYVVVRRRRQ